MPAIERIERLTELTTRAKYLDWGWRVGSMGDGFFVQVAFGADGRPQYGRKWYVSRYATVSETLQTLLLAVITAAEHEVREKFLVDGLAIFGPHIDHEALAEASQKRELRAAPV